ncbi:MAG: helix-turn-helix transcriptional regulator [Actinobacteria bacterium]|nr:helix-turn-helix transcriptional regulator [Actinomycetota bacterium]
MLLGELIWRRGYGYGYELRDQLLEFSEALGYSDTAVYSALKALDREGFVRVVERDGPIGKSKSKQAQSRVYYEVTDRGEVRFRDWMGSIPKKKPLREQLHMQLMAARADDIPHLIEALADFEQQCRDELRHLIEHPLGNRSARGRTPGAVLVGDALIAHMQAMMEWAQRSRRALVAQVEHPTGVSGRRRP